MFGFWFCFVVAVLFCFGGVFFFLVVAVVGFVFVFLLVGCLLACFGFVWWFWEGWWGDGVRMYVRTCAFMWGGGGGGGGGVRVCMFID